MKEEMFLSNLKKQAEEAISKGNFGLAFNFYNQYLQKGGRDEEVVLWIADYFIDRGKARKAINFLKRMGRKLNFPKPIVERVVTLLEEIGELDEAEEFLSSLPAEKVYELEITGKAVEEAPADEEDYINFINTFSGREGMHARMWLNRNGRVGYSPVNQPLTIPLLKKHFAGKFTLGVYQLKIDGTVLWAVFDVDISFKILRKALESREAFSKLLDKCYSYALEIQKKLKELGIPSYIEDSGFKGFHVWLFFSDPVPASIVKNFMENFLEELKPLPEEINIEIFPKQTKAGENHPGNLIKLPGGVHLKTERRSYFIKDGHAVKDIFKFLREIEKISPEEFKRKIWEFLKRRREKVPQPLQLDGDEDLLLLRKGCAVIDYIIDRILSLQPISRAEQKVLEYSVGHLPNGPAIIEKLYSLIGYKTTLKKPHRGNPVSCAKIRKELKHITSMLPCNCNFPYTDTYPNPLLHLREKERRADIPLEFAVTKYLQLLKQKREIEEKIATLEKLILKHFDRKGLNELETQFGTVKIKSNAGGQPQIVIELK